MIISKGKGWTAVVSMAALVCCHSGATENTRLEDVAANEEVARYMKAFQGRGALTDGSEPTAPKKALGMFRHPDDLRLDLVLSEPQVRQPVFMNFDHRGRLWVVQYAQYPYPAGLKVTSIDNHDRVTFDKVPQPPPSGAKGADKITFFEDTDGDGQYDKETDAVTGLNIATSVTLGRGRIWVLSPPYLLAYPDPDGDGLPDGKPVVHLKGFGLEDTHAVANSLRWGPDGWLYGAQGSTTTANISSDVSKNVAFSGQAIWRYHPETHVFEIFAEGGGNTFYVEIDQKGRIYSGDNGAARGQYYKQGGYYTKNWGKHGALTNLYAFGHLPNMGLKGDSLRFTHAWLRYEEDNLPAPYKGAMIAINPLHGFIQLTEFEPHGSSFNTIDKARILETGDRWFRPVDIKTGPDGAVYIADWYDSRLSHVDPTDTWHKSSGRIYRLYAASGAGPVKPFDLSRYSGKQLIDLLSNKNRWYRQEALRQFGDRKDRSLVPALTALLESDSGQTALEALWAIHLSGGFNDGIAKTALLHRDPFVRMWGVRLLGDERKASAGIAAALAALAAAEPHPEVRSQLASTAKRLPGPAAIPVIRNLLLNHDDSNDPDIPLLAWWAVESKAETDRNDILALFNNKTFWSRPVVREVILKRLMQRYAMAGGSENLSACARLLKAAPGKEYGRLLVAGLQEGLRGTESGQFPPELTAALAPYQKEFSGESLALSLGQGNEKALQQAYEVMADERKDVGMRLSYIRAMGEINQPGCVPVLLRLLQRGSTSNAVLTTTLQALQHYPAPEIGTAVLAAYPDKLRGYPEVREAALSLLASRAAWAGQFLKEVGNGKKIHREDVSIDIVQRLKLFNDPGIAQSVSALWPDIRPATAAEKSKVIARVTGTLKSGGGDATVGKMLFSALCGRCHRLFSEGGTLGPDLTGYDRDNIPDMLANIVDPNAFIREGYAYYHIVTNDGRNLVGKIVERQGNILKVQPVGEAAVTLNTTQIKLMKAQESSIMPEQLLDALSEQQVKDLFAYLMKKK